MASGPPPPYPGTEDTKDSQAYGYGAPQPPQAGYSTGSYPKQPGYPTQPGYPPSSQPGYPPSSQPGYPPTSQPGYPPSSQPGYPPTSQPGYPPTSQPGYPPPQAGYPPYQAGYPPPQGYAQNAHNTTVVVSQPPLMLVQKFGSVPVRTGCPHCKADIITATHFESGTFSWVICVVLCLVGCDLGCCLIPFCVEGCQDVVHTCPNCHQHIARWNRM